MQIKDYILNITKESAASYYELKVKSEERGAFVTIILITFGIFAAGPFLLTRMFLDLVDLEQYGSFMDIVIMESLVIVILALCLLNNAYRAGKHRINGQKNENYESADMPDNNVYVLTCDYSLDGMDCFEKMPYESYEAFVQEFIDKMEAYMPDDFDWDAHIGIYSYACYA